MPISLTVINFVLEKVKDHPLLLNAGSSIGPSEKAKIFDVLHVVNQSLTVNKLFLTMLTKGTDWSLLHTLRKMKQAIEAIQIGETLLLPAYIERKELALLLERTDDKLYRFVVICSDPLAGLKFHALSATDFPQIKYRTCLVLSNVSKKNTLDDVFWMSFLNMSISETPVRIFSFLFFYFFRDLFFFFFPSRNREIYPSFTKS